MTEACSEKPGWVPTTVGALGRLHCGQSPASADVNEEGLGTPYVSGPEQWDGHQLHLTKWTTGACRIAPANSIFITVKGAGVGTMFPGAPGAIGRDIYAFEPSTEMDWQFVYRALQYSIQDVIAKAHGDIPGLTKNHILDHDIVVPGYRTQRAISSKIDELFSSIEEGCRALEQVRKLVERYRQSVLNAAVTGDLTRSWREKQEGERESGEALLNRILEARRKGWEESELDAMRTWGKRPPNDAWKKKYFEPTFPSIAGLPELPTGWVWASIGQIGEISGGLTKNQRRTGNALSRPYLRVANVYTNRLELKEVHSIGVSESELKRLTLKKNDLLVVEGNGSLSQIGRVALWDGSIDGCIHQNHIIKVRMTDDLLAWYALIWCMSPGGRAAIENVASSTAGLHTLSLSKIASLPIPLPTQQELELIRDEFDRMDSLCCAQRDQISTASRMTASLRQGVLKAAFAGNLVPQDPKDEAASVLLERIVAARSKSPKPIGMKSARNKKANA